MMELVQKSLSARDYEPFGARLSMRSVLQLQQSGIRVPTMVSRFAIPPGRTLITNLHTDESPEFVTCWWGADLDGPKPRAWFPVMQPPHGDRVSVYVDGFLLWALHADATPWFFERLDQSAFVIPAVRLENKHLVLAAAPAQKMISAAASWMPAAMPLDRVDQWHRAGEWSEPARIARWKGHPIARKPLRERIEGPAAIAPAGPSVTS